MSQQFTQLYFSRVPFSGRDSNCSNKFPQGNSSVVRSLRVKNSENIADFAAYNDSVQCQRLDYLTTKGVFHKSM